MCVDCIADGSPFLQHVVVWSSNTESSMHAWPGDLLFVSFLFSEPLMQAPVVVLAGVPVCISLTTAPTSPTTLTCSLVVSSHLVRGPVRYSVSGLLDASGNAGVNVSTDSAVTIGTSGRHVHISHYVYSIPDRT